MLKLATKDDLPYVREMCKKFLDFSPYRNLAYDIDKIDQSFISLVENPSTSVVILSLSAQGLPCGMLGMSLQSLPFNESKIATEVVWWMEPEDRKTRQALELFKAAEYWAQKVGAEHIQFSSLSVSDESVDKFYTRQGYTMTEKAFLKEIK